jgi:hypothetical protein
MRRNEGVVHQASASEHSRDVLVMRQENHRQVERGACVVIGQAIYLTTTRAGYQPTRLFRSALMDSKQHPTITMSVERVAACDGARCCVHRRMAT